jgi:hypothetical protein
MTSKRSPEPLLLVAASAQVRAHDVKNGPIARAQTPRALAVQRSLVQIPVRPQLGALNEVAGRGGRWRDPGKRLLRSHRPIWSAPFSPAHAASQGERGASSQTRRCPETGQKLCQRLSTIASASALDSSVCPVQVPLTGRSRQRVSTPQRTRGGNEGLLVRVRPGSDNGPCSRTGALPRSVSPLLHPT